MEHARRSELLSLTPLGAAVFAEGQARDENGRWASGSSSGSASSPLDQASLGTVIAQSKGGFGGVDHYLKTESGWTRLSNLSGLKGQHHGKRGEPVATDALHAKLGQTGQLVEGIGPSGRILHPVHLESLDPGARVFHPKYEGDHVKHADGTWRREGKSGEFLPEHLAGMMGVEPGLFVRPKPPARPDDPFDGAAVGTVVMQHRGGFGGVDHYLKAHDGWRKLHDSSGYQGLHGGKAGDPVTTDQLREGLDRTGMVVPGVSPGGEIQHPVHLEAMPPDSRVVSHAGAVYARQSSGGWADASGRKADDEEIRQLIRGGLRLQS